MPFQKQGITHISVFCSIQSGQIANYSSCYKIYIYVSQLFISRMLKMCVIPQLVSAPLSLVTLKILRLNYFSPCEITCGKYCPVTELRFTDILFRCLKLGNTVKHLSVKKTNKQQQQKQLISQMNYHLPLIKLGQKRSGELRGFSKTRQNPRELGVFSDVRTTKSRIDTGGHRICVCSGLLNYSKCTGFYCLFLIGSH